MVRSNQRLDVLAGMMLLALCHAFATGLCFALYALGTQLSSSPDTMFFVWYAWFAIGLTQLIYVIPLCLWLKRRRRFDMLKGVIIGAVITVLLNGSCFLLGLYIVSNMHNY
jgi:Na+/proline symporter